jgi:hypothetical protein
MLFVLTYPTFLDASLSLCFTTILFVVTCFVYVYMACFYSSDVYIARKENAQSEVEQITLKEKRRTDPNMWLKTRTPRKYSKTRQSSTEM